MLENLRGKGKPLLPSLVIMLFLLSLALALALDTDNDGVENAQDQCADSSPFEMVGPNGCPMDADPQQHCDDGVNRALPWTCAPAKPLYCRGGTPPQFENNCAFCGCPEGESCQGDGSCATLLEAEANPEPVDESEISENVVAHVPTHSTDCYSNEEEGECESAGCYWDTSFFDECMAFCSELSDADCGRYSSCLLMQTGSILRPTVCVDPYELRSNVYVSFSRSIGEITEGSMDSVPLTIPEIAIARRDPDVDCEHVAIYDDFRIEWECDDGDNPPIISARISAVADAQCEGDEIVQYSLGCGQDLCTVSNPTTFTLIIHDSPEDCS
jgi:hypothetical protein